MSSLRRTVSPMPACMLVIALWAGWRGGDTLTAPRAGLVAGGRRRELAAPMLRYIGPGAKPHLVATAHVFEQLDQALAAAGPADQPVVQSDGQKLRRAALAFPMEHVE